MTGRTWRTGFRRTWDKGGGGATLGPKLLLLRRRPLDEARLQGIEAEALLEVLDFRYKEAHAIRLLSGSCIPMNTRAVIHGIP